MLTAVLIDNSGQLSIRKYEDKGEAIIDFSVSESSGLYKWGVLQGPEVSPGAMAYPIEACFPEPNWK